MISGEKDLILGMNEALLIFPHQLFEAAAEQAGEATVYVIEDDLFFGQYKFHQKKLVLHRATMQIYFKKHFSRKGRYLDHKEVPDMSALAHRLKLDGVGRVRFYDLVDDWLENRLAHALTEAGIEYEPLESPGFICTKAICAKYFKGKDKYLLHHFYVGQRKRMNLLMNNGEPAGGRWSLDQENRKKIPKGESIPSIRWPNEHKEVKAARVYVKESFAEHYGSTDDFCYAVTREDALMMLEDFLEKRFDKYGVYQDAMKSEESFLFHSLLTPSLNIGLLTPDEVIERVVDYGHNHSIPLNSVEGFVRQVIGWREFIRGVYNFSGRKQRTQNYWKHQRKIPESFWQAKTGIEPVDIVIRRVLKTGYAHHIERLMILGNFMMLCEFDPDDVYLWFMELFIDAYDWVMVPNVYGMSQHADGGLMATKPYISSSNYVRKMSDFKKGPWCEIWDGLFWRFIDKHRKFFSENPRLNMMVAQLDKMRADKKKNLLNIAEDYLNRMDIN